LHPAYASFRPFVITSVWSLCEREALVTFANALPLEPRFFTGELRKLPYSGDLTGPVVTNR
jgi:hypothetical protein